MNFINIMPMRNKLLTLVTEDQARLVRELQDLANEFKVNDNNASS